MADLQAIIDSAIGPGGTAVAEVILPACRIDVSETVHLSNVFGLVIRGAAGPVGTELVWTGAGNVPMWELNRTQWVSLENFSIRAAHHPLLEGVRIQQGPDEVGPNRWPSLESSFCTLDRIVFRGGGLLGTCVRVYRHPTDNGKNDHHTFRRVQCAAFAYAGFVIEGRNAKAIILDDCFIQGRNTGLFGIDTVRDAAPAAVGGTPNPGIYNSGAQVFSYGIRIVGVETAVRIGDRNGNFSIDGGYSEDCARLLLVPHYDDPGSGGPCAISIKDFRFALRRVASDRIIVDCRGGSLSIIDCTLGSLQPHQHAKIHVHTPGSFRFEGNFIPSDDPPGNVIFTDRPPDGAITEWGQKNRTYRGHGGMVPLVP
jgi:hypothetical protein